MRILAIFVLAGALIGCGHEENSNSAEDPVSLSVGSIRSTDLAYLPLDEKFNSLLVSENGDSQQIMLEVLEGLIARNLNDPARWAMAVRKDSSQTGIVFAGDAEIKIFSNYIRRTDFCCGPPTGPFSDYDDADESYIAIGGYIRFINDPGQATFDLDFQHETSVGSGTVEGPIVKVEGCWNGGEGGVSGCEIGQY